MSKLNEGGSSTGMRLATKITYTRTLAGVVQQEQVYALLDPFTAGDGTNWPAVSENDYKRYTPEQAQERAAAFLTSLEKCTNFTVLNTVVIDDEDCGAWHCTGEFSEPVDPEEEQQQQVQVIGYNRETLLDFGIQTFLKA